MMTHHDRSPAASVDDRRSPRVRRTAPSTTWCRLGAVLLVAHGIAHLVGTTEAMDAIDTDGSVSYLFGRWDVAGAATLMAVAAVWATVAAVFVVAAIAVWTGARWWRTDVVGIVAVSTSLCLVALPQAAIGVLVNAFVLVGASRATPRCEEEPE